MINCILCESQNTETLYRDNESTYLQCNRCSLVFLKPGQRLEPDEEKSRYDLHENDPADPDYRQFLSQLFIPLQNRLSPNSFGLDYGSGPGPTLHIMFEEAGHRMNIFDPFYDNNQEVLNNTYDFITTTETAEHFYYPKQEFNLLWSLLKPGGYLGIMTKLLHSPEKFYNWHYKDEDTHVTFYSKSTFLWLSEFYGSNVEFFGDRTVIFKK